MNGFLIDAIVYILAAIVCVPIAKKLGLGSVLGYLIAGILIGPYVLGFIQDGQSGQDIMHTTEFGVVMMLFLIGLELEPKNLWKMKDLILRVGLTQVLVSTLLLFGLAFWLGNSWEVSLTMGMAMALSSTAIVLQSLKERNQLDSASGKISFGILLMQDIAVIPILAILPLLATDVLTSSEDAHAGILENQPGWVQTLMIFGAIGVVVLLGRFGFGPLLNWVSRTKLRELFTASALLIVVGIAYLMGLVGLSPALGTFLAGVILANSPYKHALESDLDPFKGLLLGIFFMAVGATINFNLIGSNPTFLLLFTLGIMAVKALVLFIIGKVKKLGFEDNLGYAIGLAQVSEFSFVIYAFALQLGFLSSEVSDSLMAITALSMAFTPIFGVILDKTILRSTYFKKPKSERAADSISEKNAVILVGFSHFGSTLGRFLRANGIEATVLDFDPDQVEFLRKMGFKVFYGDATRPDLLHSAGAETAKILISAVNSEETNKRLIEVCHENFPHLELMIRAKNRMDAYEFMEMGIENIYREHLDTSIRMGEDALKKLGFRAYTVHRLAAQFKKYDEDALKILAKYKNDEKEYLSKVRKQIEQQEAMISGELSKKFSLNDHAWDSEQMKSEKKS